jgi:hypothetical protein
MTDPTARDLIQRLADALTAHHQLPGRVPLINEARAYLAAPDGPAVPDGREPASVAYEPSDDELHDLWRELYRFHDGATSGEVATIARAVLARYGHQSPQPIPLSERQPELEDCRDEGWCWFYTPMTDWKKAVLPVSPAYTHWLPHWALPVPQEVE